MLFASIRWLAAFGNSRILLCETKNIFPHKSSLKTDYCFLYWGNEHLGGLVFLFGVPTRPVLCNIPLLFSKLLWDGRSCFVETFKDFQILCKNAKWWFVLGWLLYQTAAESEDGSLCIFVRKYRSILFGTEQVYKAVSTLWNVQI